MAKSRDKFIIIRNEFAIPETPITDLSFFDPEQVWPGIFATQDELEIEWPLI